MSEQPDTTDGETNSTLRPTRRQTLGALAAAGVLGATAVGQEEGELLNAGGGPMSDAQDEFRVQRYRGTFAERPEPGVARRVWEVDDPGHENHGAIYVDDGESWTLVDRKVGSLDAVDLDVENSVDLEDTELWQERGKDIGPVEADSLDIAGDWVTAVDSDDLADKLDASSDGDTIALLNQTYAIDTVPSNVHLMGTYSMSSTSNGSRLVTDEASEITVEQGAKISGVRLPDDDTIDTSGRLVTFESISFRTADVNINHSDCEIYQCEGGSVTFDSGTDGGIIDSCRNVSVDDQGDNIEGTIG